MERAKPSQTRATAPAAAPKQTQARGKLPPKKVSGILAALFGAAASSGGPIFFQGSVRHYDASWDPHRFINQRTRRLRARRGGR